MSLIANQNLFELAQLLTVSSVENEPRHTNGSNEPSKSRQIVSYSSSQDGRLLVYAAAETRESPPNSSMGTNDRPFIGSVLLSRSDESLGTNDSITEAVTAELYWLAWFQDTKLQPTCVTLSHDNDFCLIGCENGSIYLVWTRILCPGYDSCAPKDPNSKEWHNKRTHKIFPVDSTLETKATHVRCDKPTCLSWWLPTDSLPRAIVGTRTGWIVVLDLTTGKELGFTHLTDFKIVSLEQLTDEASDCTYLFITNEQGKQWRVLLERRSSGYLWGRRKQNLSTSSSSSDISNVKTSIPNGSSEPAKKSKICSDEEISTRSRLAGLKQMSVASLASLRQRLSESRKMLDIRGKGSAGTLIGAAGQGLGGATSGETLTSSNISMPESLASKVGDTQLTVQRSRDDSQVLAGLFPDTSILTLHNSELEVLPQVAFRLPRNTEKVLILDKVMLVANKPDERCSVSCQTIQIISSHHAEIHLDSRSKEDPVLQNFVLAKTERILGFQRLRGIHLRIPTESSSTSTEDENENDQGHLAMKVQDQRGVIQDPREEFVSEIQAKVVAAKSRGTFMFEPCVVVTSYGIFLLKFSRDPVTTFLDCAMQSDFKTAEHTAATFDLDGRGLLELAADIRLSKRDFPGAIALYRLSGCKHLKAVLKFAHSGNVHELLSYLTTLFKTSSAELTFTDRIHLSNLMLMSFFQQALTKHTSVNCKAEFLSRVCAFLDENNFFESGLAVRLAAETREWGLLHHLCHKRGLYREMLATICGALSDLIQHDKSPAIHDFSGKFFSEFTASEQKGLWACLSNSNNLTSCVSAPNLGIEILRILMTVLPAFDISDIEAQTVTCSPHRPDFRPLLRSLMTQKLKQPAVQTHEFVIKLLHYYVTVELLLIKKLCSEILTTTAQEMSHFSTCDSNLVRMILPKLVTSERKKWPESPPRPIGKFIAAGFSHVLVIRPRYGSLLSFGSSNFGVLGHNGPLMTSAAALSQQHFPPRQVEFFAQLSHDEITEMSSESPSEEDFSELESGKEHSEEPVTILSVACGRTHSLALTDCGLYAWGSSKYGQLGLGMAKFMSSQPSLVTELCDLVIVDISAGSYHSAAVDSQGNLWTWGWGVHGQLGLGGIEDEFLPRRVLDREMCRERCIQVEAGYAHTLVLTDVGHVWAFGCGVFGQLGNGDIKKRTSPILIDFRRTLSYEGLDDKIGIISTGYFHNLAVSRDNQRLYIWGCNPQVLRLEAQQKRKERLQVAALRDQKNDLSPPGSSSNETDEVGNKNTEGGESQNEESSSEDLTHFLPSRVDISNIQSPIAAVSCGNQHSMILTEEGSVFSFGRNIDGQLGLGNRKESKAPTLVSALKDSKIFEISCGADYSLALNESGTIFAWGNNAGGQLGKPPIDVSMKESDKVVVMKGTKRIIRLAHSLQNSCDVPKPVAGLTSGVYSKEFYDKSRLHARYVSGLNRMQETIDMFSRLKAMKDRGDTENNLSDKIGRHRLNLHLVLESFYTNLDTKKLVKKCLISENPQAAAKLFLLSDGNVLQAFDMTLQACIKQKPPIVVQKLSEQIFEAFFYFFHYDALQDGGEIQTDSVVKQQLLGRLIACWQDQKFGFIHLERLVLERATPSLLQTLVVTLFCPNNDCEKEGPMAVSGGHDSCGPTLVNLFTPEFCLKIGDNFVKSFRDEVPVNMEKFLRYCHTTNSEKSNADEKECLS